MNPLLTPAEIAKILNVSYRMVLDLIIMGELKAFKIGKFYRITEGVVHQFLEANKFKSGWKK